MKPDASVWIKSSSLWRVKSSRIWCHCDW